MLAGSKEHCVCAAVRLDTGEIVLGSRHSDCLLAVIERGLSTEYISQAKQGFMTSFSRFVDRKEGMEIQKESGLTSAYSSDGGYHGTDLFSEDLY